MRLDWCYCASGKNEWNCWFFFSTNQYLYLDNDIEQSIIATITLFKFLLFTVRGTNMSLQRRRNVGMNVIIICLGGLLLLFLRFEVILNLSQFPDFLSTFQNMWKQLFYHHYAGNHGHTIEYWQTSPGPTATTNQDYFQDIPVDWILHVVGGERPELSVWPCSTLWYEERRPGSAGEATRFFCSL